MASMDDLSSSTFVNNNDLQSPNMKPNQWGHLTRVVRFSKKISSQIVNRVPHSFCFRKLNDIVYRVYFISPPSTIVYVDVNIELGIDIPGTTFKWNTLLDHSKIVYNAESKEEQLLRERKRLGSYGISSYDFSPNTATFAFMSSNGMYVMTDTNDEDNTCEMMAAEIFSTQNASRIDPKLCPTDTCLVAFVCNADIWVVNYPKNIEERLTFCGHGFNAGAPSFVTQEEFDRYTGYWWQPTQEGCNVHRILYEEVDERGVKTLKMVTEEGQEVEEFSYPQAGSLNAKSSLKIVEFKCMLNGTIFDVENFDLYESLNILFPWMEYLVRANWTPDGRYIVATLLDRLQKRLAIILFTIDAFLCKNIINDSPNVYIIHEEESSYWININDILYFLPTEHENLISFIYASENTGYSHLYRKVIQLNQNSPALNHPSIRCSKIITNIQLTQGNWPILPKKIWIDNAKKLVYFQGFKDTSVEQHLYVTSYEIYMECHRISTLSYSHAIELDPTCQTFLTVNSNVRVSPAVEIFKILQSPSFQIENLGNILNRTSLHSDYIAPKLYVIRPKDFDVHAMVYEPLNRISNEKYPTILYVYGGPQVQMVQNVHKGSKLFRLQMFTMVGFVVVVLDCRGSSNRGLIYERDLLGKLGQIEIDDQVEALTTLANKFCQFIDFKRVAIHGWSYGGYLSLMGLAKRPDIFKVAVVGAPVTSWLLYDTAYTERYMGLPEDNIANYNQSSVINMVPKFPDEENRLLIFHGLMDDNVHFQHTSSLIDALNKYCKPYYLQIYPKERHGIRNPEVSEHYETSVLSFLKQNL